MFLSANYPRYGNDKKRRHRDAELSALEARNTILAELKDVIANTLAPKLFQYDDRPAKRARDLGALTKDIIRTLQRSRGCEEGGPPSIHVRQDPSSHYF